MGDGRVLHSETEPLEYVQQQIGYRTEGSIEG